MKNILILGPRYVCSALLAEIRSLNVDQSDWYRRAGMQVAGTDLQNVARAARRDLLLIRRHIMNINGSAYAEGI